jgi:hypothetical protein
MNMQIMFRGRQERKSVVKNMGMEDERGKEEQ